MNSLPAALDPAGPEALAVSDLIWWFTALCTAIWLMVMIGLAVALWRRRSERRETLAVSPPQERRFGLTVGSLTVLTGVTVIALAVLSFAALQRLFAATDAPLTVQVIGHQWWWEFRYQDADPSRTLTTANELHVPVGQQVALDLTSVDVIHSFWVPGVMGKADLVPGRQNRLVFTVDKPGTYAGQCAEFCGLQHTFMGIRVIAHSRDDFEGWKSAQVAASTPPGGGSEAAGYQVFLSSPCVSCHAVRGTPAGGTFGPDLTHLASRSTIAAGTLPLNRGTLAAWVVDPQGIKPGTNMPTIKLEPEKLEVLLDYLMGLK